MIKSVLNLLVLLFASLLSPAQPTCVEPSRINPYYPCSECYRPVCGCDGITYRHICAAENWGGVNSYVGGICGNFELDFVPNPIDPFYGGTSCDHYAYVFVNPNNLPANADVFIYDILYATPYYFKTIALTSNDLFGPGKGTPIPDLNNAFFSTLKEGIYILYVQVNGERRSKKLVVVNTRK